MRTFSIVFLVLCTLADAQEEPQWTLDLRVLQIRAVTQGNKPYWLLEYEVTNKTKEDRRFIPVLSADLVTAKGVKDIVVTLDTETGNKLLNSVTVAKDPIKAGSSVKAYAVWEGTPPPRILVEIKGLTNRPLGLRIKMERDPKGYEVTDQEWK